MITLKFYLRKNRCNRAGESALYFIVNTPAPVWIAADIFIRPDDWNQDKQCIENYCSKYNALAPLISNLKWKADLFLQKVNTTKFFFTAENFTAAVITGELQDVEDPTIRELSNEYININNFSWGRIQQYKTLCDQLEAFSPGLRLKRLNFVFIKRLEQHLLSRNNDKSTIARKMKQLKAIVHFAQHKKIISEDPLKSYHISSYKGKRVALSKEELLQLQDIFDSGKDLPPKLFPVLRYFLFCCYTGLRYGDLKTLCESDIQNDIISIDMHKTGRPVIIPVLDQAARLIDPQPGGRCFRVFANQATNRCLKEIALLTGISKHLSFHVARHTFATVSLSLGMNIKVISEILGHSSVQVTELYTHVVEQLKTEEMKKWKMLIA